MCDSNGFFAGISPTSSGFASRKKIRYDRRNKRMVREGSEKMVKVPNRVKKLIFVMIGVGFLLILSYRTYIAIYIKPYTFIDLKEKIVDYDFIENGKLIVTKWDYSNKLDYYMTKNNGDVLRSYPIVGKTKIVKEYHKLKDINDMKHNIPDGKEYWGITIYNIKNKKLTPKDYDLFKMTREYNKSYVPDRIDNVIYISNGKELLDIYLKSPKDHYKKDIIKSIDLQSGKVIDQGDTTEKEVVNDSTNYISFLPIHEQLTMADRRISLDKTKNFPESDATIFDKYPNTKDLFSESHSMIGILADRPSVDTNIPILQLLVNPKTNLFKNVTIPAEYSIDGQEHEIHSYDEFKQFYNKIGNIQGE